MQYVKKMRLECYATAISGCRKEHDLSNLVSRIADKPADFAVGLL